MKIKSTTKYKIIFYTFVALTAVLYIWAACSLVCWIFKLIVL